MHTKHLYRSRENRIVAGVCGGIAEYFELDPVIIRLAFVILALAQGVGILAYFIAWVVIPENPNQADASTTSASAKEDKANDFLKQARGGNNSLGFILIALGLIFLIQNIFPFWFDVGQLWPLIIIGAGVWMIFGRRKE